MYIMNIGPFSATHRLGSEHKKSSVLVTRIDDPEEQARKLCQEQSRAVIEGFMQARSHQHVLEKPCSSHLKGKKHRTSGHSDAEVCSVGYSTPSNLTPGEGQMGRTEPLTCKS